MNVAWKEAVSLSPGTGSLRPPRAESPRTYQARQDGGQPHVPAITGVVHLVNELVRGPHVPTHALQGVHAVGEGSDV